jgi:hypothetical protein
METSNEIDFVTVVEGKLIDEMTDALLNFVPKNEIKKDYYEGKNAIKNLEIAIPKLMEGYRFMVGWARTVIDTLVKRMILENVIDRNNPWLEKFWKDNKGRLKSQMQAKDSCTYGTGYALLGAGDPSQLEPDLLMTIESPFSTVGKEGRSGELTALLKVVYDKEGKPKNGSLYTPGQIINFNYKGDKTFSPTGYTLTGRFETGLPFIPAERFANNPAGSDNSGTSELTPSIISVIDSAVRTLAQGEFSKELYSHPQRVFLNVDPKTAQAMYENGIPTPVDGAIVIQANELSGNALDGEKYGPQTTVQQLEAANPEPFIAWVKAYAQLIAGESGLPLSRLGYPTSNPSSAEALRAEETELVRNANMRKDAFEASWLRLIVKAFYITFGRMPEEGELDVEMLWCKPEVQTPAADIDGATKLSAMDPQKPGAKVFYAQAGLKEEQITRIMDEASDVQVLKGDLATVASAARTNNPILEKLAQMNRDPEAGE